MKHLFRITVLPAAVAALGLALAGANEAAWAASSSGQESGKSKVSRQDRKFVEKAAEDGLAEIEMGKLAQEKAQSPEVKQLGQKLIDDHTKANDQLKEIASTKGIEVPQKPDRSARKEIDKLQKLSGGEFDREFTKHAVKDHKKAIDAFEKQAKSGDDPQLRAFAEQTVPKLKEHLQIAQSAQNTAGDGGASTSDGGASTKRPHSSRSEKSGSGESQ